MNTWLRQARVSALILGLAAGNSVWLAVAAAERTPGQIIRYSP
jgi:hypothetical protein